MRSRLRRFHQPELVPLPEQARKGDFGFQSGESRARTGLLLMLFLGGKLADKLGPRPAMLGGLGLMAVGTLTYTQLSADPPLWLPFDRTTAPHPRLRAFHEASDAGSRLVCFPHAGGFASYYFPLSRALSPSVEVLGVQYPGRMDRSDEPAIEDIGALAEEVPVTPNGMHHWANHTSAEFATRSFPGGHFYLNGFTAPVTDAVRAALPQTGP